MRAETASLKEALPTGTLLTDHDVLVGYSRDQTALADSGKPWLAVIAKSVTDVQATLSYASDHGIPVVTRGAGSGLAGGANAVDGCILLVMTAMDLVLDVNSREMYATVEAGVLNSTLKAQARATNLFYPPDPASSTFCTIGGNIATNAGGLCCLKYGVTRDYVLAMDVVLADGTLVHTGSTTRKNVAGYDLTGN